MLIIRPSRTGLYVRDFFSILRTMNDRSDELYKINNTLDDIRTLFYTVLDFPIDDFSERKDKAKRELRFALLDLLNSAENL